MHADLWPVINGPGDVVARNSSTSDYVCFTGSTATGRKVETRCAERLIGCSLELGGKNPLLVLDDADVESRHRAPFGRASPTPDSSASPRNGCTSPSRCSPTSMALVARPGAADRWCWTSSRHRGLINAGQVERISPHVEDAKAKGAIVLTGGRRGSDLGQLFYEPTVLTGVTPEMDCFADETFGPVVSVYPARDDEDAIAQANASSYGLNASVWTSDPDRGRRVASQIHCGTVNVNEGFAATFGSIDAPMGGMKQSGLGRRQGREGIRRFVEVQSIGTQSGIPIAPSHGLAARVHRCHGRGLRMMKRLGRA